MLRSEELIKTYQTGGIETTALNRINIVAEKGEFIAIVGPSGSGKTTLFNIIGLLDGFISGRLWFNGLEVTHLNDLQRTRIRRGKIGFVFQGPGLIDNLSVYQNIELPLLYLGYPTSERKRLVNESMEKIGLAHRRKDMPKQLTGCQQQKLAIARAVALNPLLLLADEPTGNLDSVNSEEIMNLFTEINQNGTTILFVTHSAADADKANRIIHIFDGKIVSENSQNTLDYSRV